MPKYNILLKDDKGYSYIKITKGPWGKISPCFRKDDDKADYLGPYTGNFSVTNAVEQATEIFKLPTCNKVFPKDIKSSRPCLNYFISRCSAPCAGKINQKEYEESLKSAIAFLKGGSSGTVKALRAEMEEAAENLDFEKAAKLRDRIKAIERISQKQKVIMDSSSDEDVFAIAQRGTKACLSVLSFEQGALKNSEHFIFDSDGELSDERQSLITSYYSLDRKIPPLVVIDGDVTDSDLVAQWLSEKKGRKVTVLKPQRGEKVKVMEMCLSNAAQKLSEHSGFVGADTAVLDELMKILGLKKTPEYIEAYDISHTAGSDNVAGMVVFKDARPLRSAYKRFSIKSFSGQDDYGSMREVISRRLNRYVENEGSEEGFGKLPDLILLDGGQGQVNAVKPIIEAFGLDIPVFGMVKDSKHRTRAIASGGEEISINSGRRVFTLISSIQEEVHRFAITYHKSKHTKNSLTLSLTKIEGIGEKKAALLLKHFKTLSAVRTAEKDTLLQVKGINKNDAENIYKYFRTEKK